MLQENEETAITSILLSEQFVLGDSLDTIPNIRIFIPVRIPNPGKPLSENRWMHRNKN